MTANSTLKAARSWLILFSLVFFVPLAANAQTGIDVRDFGAIAGDGVDDAPAFQAAVDAAFEKHGGTIVIPAGRYDIKQMISIIPDGYVGAEVMFAGQKGAILGISVGRDNIAFKGGNLNSLVFEDITFIGKNVAFDNPDFFDARHVIYADHINQFNLTRCNFFGLATQSTNGAQTGIIYVGDADAKFVDSQFDGDLSLYPTGSIIEAVDFKGLTVSRCTFLDYANLGGEYFSKSTAFVGAWIRAKNTSGFNKAQQRRIFIEDSRFDEGAAYALDIVNVPWVTVRGIYVNVNGTSAGRGIRMFNVEFARVEQSSFGLARYARPAIEVFNCVALYVAGLRFSEEVFFLSNNGLQDLKVEFCPQCTTGSSVFKSKTRPRF